MPALYRQEQRGIRERRKTANKSSDQPQASSAPTSSQSPTEENEEAWKGSLGRANPAGRSFSSFQGRSVAAYIQVQHVARSSGAHKTFTQRARFGVLSLHAGFKVAPALRRSHSMRRMWAYSGPEQIRPKESENLGEPESRPHILCQLSWAQCEKDAGPISALQWCVPARVPRISF